ncbi:hypothetical protein ELAN111203_18460 [Elizabethkingia anophelis]
MLIKYTLKYRHDKYTVFAANFSKAVEQIENDLKKDIDNRKVNIVSAIKINLG